MMPSSFILGESKSRGEPRLVLYFPAGMIIMTCTFKYQIIFKYQNCFESINASFETQAINCILVTQVECESTCSVRQTILYNHDLRKEGLLTPFANYHKQFLPTSILPFIFLELLNLKIEILLGKDSVIIFYIMINKH